MGRDIRGQEMAPVIETFPVQKLFRKFDFMCYDRLPAADTPLDNSQYNNIPLKPRISAVMLPASIKPTTLFCVLCGCQPLQQRFVPIRKVA